MTYPQASYRPGPEGHVYPETNSQEGAIFHSAEGHWGSPTDNYDPVDTMVERGVSWHFTVYLDGRVEQHYPLTASCWHAGSGKQNRRLIGVEHEERQGEPMPEAQVKASVALARWLQEQCGWPRLERRVTLFEHREVYPTSCPGGLIPWSLYTSGPEPVEESDLGKIATDLVYGIKQGRVELIEHGPSPARQGWMRLQVDYLP